MYLPEFRAVALLACLVFTTAPHQVAATTPPVNQAPAAPMVVSYYNRGTRDLARNNYKFELIQAALEITRADFGDFVITPYANEPSPKRQAQLIRNGTQLNLLWASPGTAITQTDVIQIPIKILHGLQGYRICLINKAAPIDASLFTDAKSLAQLSMGQGNWSDVQIYQHHQLQPRLAPHFETLFEMLKAKRFQCLPLGANEIVTIYNEKKQQYPDLAIDSQLLIYYEFPIYFYVSTKQPRLAERMTLGLEKLQANGRFEEIFVRHHARDLARLKLDKRKLICLASPYIDNSEQCAEPPQLPQ